MPTHQELERMLDEAAQRGAVRALEAIGLHDAEAGRDIAEIRGLVTAYRSLKKGAWQATGRVMLQIVVAFVILAVMMVSTRIHPFRD